MIWEILQMITGPLLAGGIIVLVTHFICFGVVLIDPYSTHDKKHSWMMIFICVLILTMINLIVFSISTVNIKYLEKEQVTCNCKCAECSKIPEALNQENKE